MSYSECRTALNCILLLSVMLGDYVVAIMLDRSWIEGLGS
jgi:hypothetical protein